MTFLSKFVAGIFVTASTAGFGVLRFLHSGSEERLDPVKTAEQNESPSGEKEPPVISHFLEQKDSSSPSDLREDVVENSLDGTHPPLEETRTEILQKPKCEVFKIVNEQKKEVVSVDWESLKKEDRYADNRNKGFGDDVKVACEGKDPVRKPSDNGKIYVSERSGIGTYSSGKQKLKGWILKK